MKPLEKLLALLERAGISRSDFVAACIKDGLMKPGATLESLSLAELSKVTKAIDKVVKERKRLGGKSVSIPNMKPLRSDRIYQLNGMNQAVELYYRRFKLHPVSGYTREMQEETATKMLNGTPALPSIVEKAEKLIDQAIEIDPRLAKKAAWVRSEEGIDGCAALIAAGDDRPFFDRRRRGLADRATIEPCRVVISTDSRHVSQDNAAAFIAAAKLSQQFRPLDLWWQGAWLLQKDDAPIGTPGVGHIIHVPLVQGDLDFRRLEFVLSSRDRDAVSFSIMFSHAYKDGYGWGGGVAERSYLDDTTDFVRESGITANAEQVASYAARWAGMEPLWQIDVSPWQAEQYWNPNPPKWEGATEADRERWRRENEQREKERQKRSQARLADIG